MGLIHYLRQLLGHTSVPLLSLISGYLLARTLSARPYVEELSHKWFSLIVPLVLVTLGISGAWIGNLTVLEPYRIYLAGLALQQGHAPRGGRRPVRTNSARW